MLKIIAVLVVTLVFIGAKDLAMAQNVVPGFTAVCTTSDSRRYDSGYRYDGTRMEPEWSENERFFQPDRSFSYTGGESIDIDGEKAHVVIFSPDLMFAMKSFTGPLGKTVATYVIHVKMKEILQTNLNGSVGGAPSVKGQLLTFDCKWSFH